VRHRPSLYHDCDNAEPPAEEGIGRPDRHRRNEGCNLPIRTRYTIAEVERDVASNAIRQLLGLDVAGPLLLSRMVEEISKHDAELLDELGRLIDEKRRKSPK